MSLVHESNLARSCVRLSTDASDSHFLVNCKACTGVIQRLGGELKFGGCYKCMLMFSSASFLSDGDCSLV